MRSLIFGAGLAATLLATALAASPAPATASGSLDVAWTEGHHWWPDGRPYPWSHPWPRTAWYGGWYGNWNGYGNWSGAWWPRYPAGNPWWTGEARVDTVKHELATDAFRLRNDRLDGRVGVGEAASLGAEDAAIRAEANRDAAPWGGISYGEFLRLQGEVHTLSAEISRADRMPAA